MNIRLVATLLVGTVLGFALYAVLRGDATPEHPTFEQAADAKPKTADEPTPPPADDPPAAASKPAAKPARSRDLRIVPGERIGKLTPDASEETLRRAYGNANVGPVTVSLGEGNTAPGSVVFPGTDRELQIVWVDTDAKRKPLRVTVVGDAWRTRSGVGIGSTLAELETLNGKPFALTGFGWDYAGTVVDWRGGELADEVVGEGGRMIVRLDPGPDADSSAVLGDSTFLSSEPAMQSLAPAVGDIVLEFAQQASPESELARKLVGRWTLAAAQSPLLFELRADGTVFLQVSQQGTTGAANGRWAISGRRFSGRISASNLPQFPVGYAWSDEVVSVTESELVLRNQHGQLEEYMR